MVMTQLAGEGGNDLLRAGAGNDFATGQMGSRTWSIGEAGDDELFGGPADDVVNGRRRQRHRWSATSADDVLLGGKGDDLMTGDNPPTRCPVLTQGPSNVDVCNGQQAEGLRGRGVVRGAQPGGGDGPMPE